MRFEPSIERIHRLLVKTYKDEDCKEFAGLYVAFFGYIPRVGEIILQHDRIENARKCRVKYVCAIARDEPDSTDVDAVIYAIHTDFDLDLGLNF